MKIYRQVFELVTPTAIAAFLTSCTTTSAITPTEQIYIAYSVTDRKSSEFSRSANYEIAKNTNRDRQVNIDILTDDRALITSVKRLQEILKTTDKLTAYLVTSGTTNPDTLSAIAAIAQEISQERGSKQLKIYLLGLSPQNKIPTTAAFKAIADRMGGSCIDDYSQCRTFIDDLIE